MKKHSAKRFDSKDKLKKETKRSKKAKKKLKLWKIFLLLIIIVIIILVIYFKEPILKFINKSFKAKNNNETNNTNSMSLSDILAIEVPSKYETKKLEGSTFSLTNLCLKYENNITVIEFDFVNEDSKEQSIPNFTLTLLDESGTNIISYNLSSSEIISPNNKKQFVLIASRDVSNTADYKIEIKK